MQEFSVSGFRHSLFKSNPAQNHRQDYLQEETEGTELVFAPFPLLPPCNQSFIHDSQILSTVDANLDREFNHFDIIFALRGGKYREDVFANWGEGDWTGNGRFDQFDIIEALRTGNYLQGPYVARSR